ncbi:hypothetical protein G9A89_018424 [Geosiphon pyriformis]|nr:hypothetical protein G9A89_018424 [Geosiphon pyriformis]
MNKSDNAQEASEVRLHIDVVQLEGYLTSKIADFKVPLEIKQFSHGLSNPTYLLIDASKKRYVLRKKPPGSLLSITAHAVEREFRVLDALGRRTDVPVPKVMEFLEGRIFKDMRLLSLSTNDRKLWYLKNFQGHACLGSWKFLLIELITSGFLIGSWYSLVETLAKIHSVKYKAIDLESFGKPSGFYSRQIRSLSKVSAAQAAAKDDDNIEVGAIPRVDEIIEWLQRNQVPDETTLVHGDYKIFHPTEPRVIGVLDWELSTIGHPFSDLANLLMPYYVPSNELGPLGGFINESNLEVPSLEELMRLYCIKTNREYPIPNFDFATVFSFFRLCVITQGIAARVARKQASSVRATEFGGLFRKVANLALKIVDRGDLTNPSKL